MDQRDRPLILVVDDDPDIRDFVALELELAGFATALAIDGADGTRQAEALLPDAIIMGVMMPVMDGFEACERIKGHPALKHIPFAFLTAKVEDSSVKHGLALGADEYMRKPFDPEELVAMARRLIARG